MSKFLYIKYILSIVVFVLLIFCNCIENATGLSDTRLCADPKCKKLISTGVTKRNYEAVEAGMVSFRINTPVRIMSKSSGSDPKLWGIEVNGREGYARKDDIQEQVIYVAERQLKHIVKVSLSGKQEEKLLKPSENVEATKLDVDVLTAPLETIKEVATEQVVTTEPNAKLLRAAQPQAQAEPQSIKTNDNNAQGIAKVQVPVADDEKPATNAANSTATPNAANTKQQQNNVNEQSVKNAKQAATTPPAVAAVPQPASISQRNSTENLFEMPTQSHQPQSQVNVEAMQTAPTNFTEPAADEMATANKLGSDKAMPVEELNVSEFEEVPETPKLGETEPQVVAAESVETVATTLPPKATSAATEAPTLPDEQPMAEEPKATAAAAKARLASLAEVAAEAQHKTEEEKIKPSPANTKDAPKSDMTGDARKPSATTADTEEPVKPMEPIPLDAYASPQTEPLVNINAAPKLDMTGDAKIDARNPSATNADTEEPEKPMENPQPEPLVNINAAPKTDMTGDAKIDARNPSATYADTEEPVQPMEPIPLAAYASPQTEPLVEINFGNAVSDEAINIDDLPSADMAATAQAEATELNIAEPAADAKPSEPVPLNSDDSELVAKTAEELVAPLDHTNATSNDAARADKAANANAEAEVEDELAVNDVDVEAAAQPKEPLGLLPADSAQMPSDFVTETALPAAPIIKSNDVQPTSSDAAKVDNLHVATIAPNTAAPIRNMEDVDVGAAVQQNESLPVSNAESLTAPGLFNLPAAQQNLAINAEPVEPMGASTLPELAASPWPLGTEQLQQAEPVTAEPAPDAINAEQQLPNVDAVISPTINPESMADSNAYSTPPATANSETPTTMATQYGIDRQPLPLDTTTANYFEDIDMPMLQLTTESAPAPARPEQSIHSDAIVMPHDTAPQSDLHADSKAADYAPTAEDDDDYDAAEPELRPASDEHSARVHQEPIETLADTVVEAEETKAALGAAPELSIVEATTAASTPAAEPLQPSTQHEPPQFKEQGLFSTIYGTVKNLLTNERKLAESSHESELDRILFNGEERTFDNQHCYAPRPEHVEVSLDNIVELFAAQVLKWSDLVLCLGITSATLLCFIFGYYCFCNSSREGGLLAKLNMLERSMLAAQKENAILKTDLAMTRKKLSSIEDNSFGSNDMVISLRAELDATKLEKSKMQEQIGNLEKELESAAEAGLELNRIVSELLSNQTGDDSILNSVEELQKQLNEQQNTIMEINANLADKSRENSELQLVLAEQQATMSSRISALEQDNDELEQEKAVLQTKLQDMKSEFDEDITRALEGKNTEIKRLQADICDKSVHYEDCYNQLQTSQAKVEALEECLKTVKKGNNNNKVEDLIDVAYVRAELLDWQKKYATLKETFDIENETRGRAAEQLATLNEDFERMKADYHQSEKDKLEAQTRLEVLSSYFKDKEAQLQKELSLKETLWFKQQGEATSTVERLTAMQEEIQALKSQNDALRAEIEAQVAAHKAQIGTLENRAHETWLEARQSERRCEEARAEAAALRRKLTALAGFPNDASAVDKNLNAEMQTIPSPVPAMEPPGSPLLGRMPPPPPFLPPHFMAPPPAFIGMPPPFLAPGEMRPAPLGRIMSPPPPPHALHANRSGRYSDPEDFDPYDDDDVDELDDDIRRQRRHHTNWSRSTYSPPRTYRSHSPESHYDFDDERDFLSNTYDTEPDLSPPVSPKRPGHWRSSEHYDEPRMPVAKANYNNDKHDKRKTHTSANKKH